MQHDSHRYHLFCRENLKSGIEKGASFAAYYKGIKNDTLCFHHMNKIINHECEGGIEKSVPRITDWHHEACR